MAAPNVFDVPDFEDLLLKYKTAITTYIANNDLPNLGNVSQALQNESTLLSMVIQAMTLARQDEIRQWNYHARQMFRKYVSDPKAVDALAAQFGLERQVIKKGNPNAYPPIPDTMESDEHLLRRYDLAPFGLHTTGTRHGYKFHALSLGERPVITLETYGKTITQTYDFPDLKGELLIKDADCRMLEPNSGKVELVILRNDGNGTPSAALIQRVSDYMNRDDIAQKTDELTVRGASIVNYTIDVTVYSEGDPDYSVDADAVKQALQAFTDKAHKLGSRVDKNQVSYVALDLGAKRVVVTQPSADIVCNWDQAPYCTEVVVNVAD